MPINEREKRERGKKNVKMLVIIIFKQHSVIYSIKILFSEFSL